MTVEEDADLVAAMATMLSLMGGAFGIDKQPMVQLTMTMAYGIKKWRESGMSLGNWMFAANFPANHEVADDGMEAFRNYYMDAKDKEDDSQEENNESK